MYQLHPHYTITTKHHLRMEMSVNKPPIKQPRGINDFCMHAQQINEARITAFEAGSHILL